MGLVAILEEVKGITPEIATDLRAIQVITPTMLEASKAENLFRRMDGKYSIEQIKKWQKDVLDY